MNIKMLLLEGIEGDTNTGDTVCDAPTSLKHADAIHMVETLLPSDSEGDDITNMDDRCHTQEE